MGRVLTEQNPVQAAADKETVFTYDPDGNLLTATDANGHTTTYAYNARNEEVSETDAMDRTASYGYDAEGNRDLGHRPDGQHHDLFIHGR